MKIPLTGNPNAGKTTVFNTLTGQTASVGNWSGVTVAERVGTLRKKYHGTDHDVTIVDLPGAYSLSPYSGEEKITRDYILDESPDVIINIVDGANLERSLFFATQLLELHVPVVIAINKSDMVKRRKNTIDLTTLSKVLNSRVVLLTATAQMGIQALMTEAIALGTAKEPLTAPQLTETHTDTTRQIFVDDIIRQSLVKETASSQVTLSDNIDRWIAHKWLGVPIFLLIMWLIFWFSIEGLGGYVSAYFNDVLFGEMVPHTANRLLESLGVHPTLQAVIVDGAIGGVGAVIGFLPLIMLLFFCLSLLEDCGYMARVAVVMDRFFKKIGLSGKSIIPMIVGSGCSIPGVMATRTIEDINERRMTTILTPFIPCGAKLPIIALFASVFFPGSTWVAPSVYMLAILMIILGGLLLKKIFVWEATSPFIMELPAYKVPSLRHATTQMLVKAKAFIYKATTIILVCNTLVWFTQGYSWRLTPVEDQSLSMLAGIGTVVSPILIPLGFVGWQLAAAAITGFIAKENVVATFAVLVSAGSTQALHLPGGALNQLFTPVTAFAFLAFNLFTPPCFAAIGAMNAEMESRSWLWKGLAFQLGIGYMLALVITQVGTLLIYGKPAPGFIPAIAITIFAIALVLATIQKADNQRNVIENAM
ncbi:Fe(2+) transporter FeoB [Paraliobacillus ryukyuensis]|uniref:Ferrous iron transport protein B n=1 Tax=Paraliobacillus ryukyuensis TaxID=200904 RepID=A0A366EBT6_9BACI|nr:ferrous iron transport protein B [Paraliobacillus ryukyuensis]RBO99836.1 ferrous iron transport protein B [Paraliobacillus ryukyuensis]